VTTLAGNRSTGLTDGIGRQATFRFPTRVAIDDNSNLYILESSNYAIRKIFLNNTVITIAGSAGGGYVDDNVKVAKFAMPVGLLLDAETNILIADYNN
jgi:hypothetical protein